MKQAKHFPGAAPAELLSFPRHHLLLRLPQKKVWPETAREGFLLPFPESRSRDAGRRRRRRRGEEQGLAVDDGQGRRGRQEAAAGPAQRRPRQARGRRARGGGRRRRRRHRRGGGAQPEGGAGGEDRHVRAPLPALPPPLQAPRLPVQGRPPGLRRVRGQAAVRAVQGVPGRRRLLRPLPRAGRRRVVDKDRVPQRRVPEVRDLPRGRRAPARVPARALPLRGARLRLRRRGAGPRGPPQRRPLRAGALHPVRQGEPVPGARVDPADAAGRRGRRPRVPAHRGRARRRGHRRVRGLRQGQRRDQAAVHLQDVDQPGGVGGRERRQGGHRAGGDADEEQHLARRRGRRRRAHVPRRAARVPGPGSRRGRRGGAHGDAPQRPHRQGSALVQLMDRSIQVRRSWQLEMQLKLSGHV